MNYRYSFLRNEIRRISSAIGEKNKMIEMNKKKLEADTKKINDLGRSVTELELTVEKNSDMYKSNQESFYNEKRARDEFVTTRKDLWRQVRKLVK